MSHTPMRRIFPSLMVCGLIMIAGPPAGFCQQTTGSIKGTVTDQLEGLVTNASVVVKDAQGKARTATTSSSGNYEFKSLPPGNYEVTAAAVGFTLREEKQVKVKAGSTTTLDLQLSIEALEQSVTVDNKGISTDSDRNGDAMVLRGRELEAFYAGPDKFAERLAEQPVLVV